MHGGLEINRETATGAPRVIVPLTGDTWALNPDDRVVYINPAGTIAALTLRLPPAPSATQVMGAVIQICFGQIVTALTVQDFYGNAVQSTAGAVATGIQYRYVSPALGWVRWR
jgi:hypothetical protein